MKYADQYQISWPLTLHFYSMTKMRKWRIGEMTLPTQMLRPQCVHAITSNSH